MLIAEQCHILRSRYPNQTASLGDEYYNELQSSYWISQQSELKPLCRFLPSNSQDVLDVLSIALDYNTSLAIASGGHSSNVGASNIESGITIDLRLMNQIEISDDQNTISIGPGARWGKVYHQLEPYGLAVAGGRLSHVGVGGLVLGGGFSWFSNQVGFACDTVQEFEVVTPDLRILQVNAVRHRDLFWALKGSLGAFGIVTRIRMRTLKTVEVFAGSVSFHERYLPVALRIMDKMADDTDEDPCTQGYLSWAYLANADEWYYAGYMMNTENRNDTTSLLAWQGLPSIHRTLRHTTIAGSADELSYGNDVGLRREKFTLTVEMNVDVLFKLHSLIRASASNIDFSKGDLLGVTFQPMTLAMLHQRATGGDGNVFTETFSTTGKPLVLVSIEMWWQDDAMDDVLASWLRTLEQSILHAVDTHPWIYPNYAASGQHPLSDHALGRRTVARLRQVKELYDPSDIWPTIAPGSLHI